MARCLLWATGPVRQIYHLHAALDSLEVSIRQSICTLRAKKAEICCTIIGSSTPLSWLVQLSTAFPELHLLWECGPERWAYHGGRLVFQPVSTATAA